MDTLQRALGYTFRDPALLEQALTHRSHSANHNERFEFLGDALLESIISIYLYRARPRTPEGDLTRLRASIVNRVQLAQCARQLALGGKMRLGQGEMKSGGQRRDSILSDALEALIAAVYLDSDFATCERVTLTLFAPVLTILPDAQSLKDAKSRLQEFLQGRGLPVPSYEIIEESGPEHARVFVVEAVSGAHCVRASGSNRKTAEQDAAAALLQLYQTEKSKKSLKQ